MIRMYVRILSVVLAFAGCVAWVPGLRGQSGVTYVYDDLGRLVGVIDPSGNAAAYTYDPVGNLLSINRYTSGQLSVLNFTPSRGPIGTMVTITGTGFSTTPSQNTVNFNGTTASVTSATANQLVTTVPSGATTGPIAVTTSAGTFTTTSSFTVTTGNGVPTITSFTPTVAVAGTAVSITGTNFDPTPANDRLGFNITQQYVGTANSTTLTTSVPASTSSGRLTLSTPGGTTQSSQDFFIPFGSHAAADVGFTGRTTLGGTQTVSLTAANKIGILVFDATAGQKITITWSSSTFSSCTLYLFSPTGTQLGSTGCTSSGLLDVTLLPATGTYTVGIEPSGVTGSIPVTLNNVSDIKGTITPGGSSVTVTTVARQDARLTFSGTTGQRVSLLISSITTPESTIYLLNPDGTSETSILFYSGNGNYFMDTQTLPTTGTYTLWAQHYSTYAGSETLQLYNVPADVTGTISIGGSAVPVSTTVPGQNASLSFSGTSGQKASASLTAGSYSNFGVTVKNPDGSTLTSSAFSGTTNFLDVFTLGTAGTYTFFIDPQGPATGGVTVKLNSDPDVTGTITPGGSSVPVTTVPGQDIRLSFSGTVGQRVSLLISSITTPIANIYLVKPDGTNQTGLTFYSGNGNYFMDTQTLATAGTYTVWVKHSGQYSGSETLQLYSVPADVTGTISIGGSAVPVSTTVPGQNASLSFSGTSGHSVTLTGTSGTYSACSLTVKGPDGSTQASGSCGGSSDTIGPFTLTTTGTFTIVIDPTGPATGGLTLQATGN